MGLEPTRLAATLSQNVMSTNSNTTPWLSLLGSNQRPTPYQDAALPTELRNNCKINRMNFSITENNCCCHPKTWTLVVESNHPISVRSANAVSHRREIINRMPFDFHLKERLMAVGILKLGCGGWIRTTDLQLMRLAS